VCEAAVREPPRVRGVRILVLAALIALVAAASADGAGDGRGGSDARAAIDARLPPASLVTPRELPVVRVRLRASSRSIATLRLVGGDGLTLALVPRVVVGPRAETVRLRLTSAGERRFGRCRVARLGLVVTAAGGRRERLRARTTPDPVRCAPLRWAPPVLDDPQTIDLGDGYSDVRLEPDRDYVLRLPPTRKLGGAFVEGGRNVVVIGGHVTLPPGTTTDQERRALYFKNQTGIVHVEGVLIDGSAGGEGDGIALSAPAATVQIENVRIVGLHGSDRGTHADVVQPWGGVRELRIDRLTGSSGFQGLQLPVALAPIGGADVRFADLRALPAPIGDRRVGHSGGHMLWLTPPGSCVGYPVALDQVWIAARPGRSIGDSVWPGVADGSACAAVGGRGGVRWPLLPVQGAVRAGVPPGGEFVPRWSVGAGYATPGYVAAIRSRLGSLTGEGLWDAGVFE
jgi:hypothetical protein